jgi:hypothetical protein
VPARPRDFCSATSLSPHANHDDNIANHSCLEWPDQDVSALWDLEDLEPQTDQHGGDAWSEDIGVMR